MMNKKMLVPFATGGRKVVWEHSWRFLMISVKVFLESDWLIQEGNFRNIGKGRNTMGIIRSRLPTL